jgi:proline dehydrogenase
MNFSTRRVWQSTMIALARSPRMKRWMQGSRATSTIATRYVAGVTAEKGVVRASELLKQKGLRSSLFYLGEYVDTPGLVEQNLAAKIEVTGLLERAGLDVHVSVDPTQIGFLLDQSWARRNAFAIAEAIVAATAGKAGVHALMLDMEDSSVVDATIGLHDALHDARLPVAVTLQAYLRRTEADLHSLIRRGSRVRLVKGAFAAGADVAFAGQSAIKTNSRRLIDLMLSREARDAGFYPIVATHDDKLQAHAIEQAQKYGWRPDEYEFEMLVGVREELAERLAASGQRVRLYLPFGRDWWPYAMRRIGENPGNAWLLARSLAKADVGQSAGLVRSKPA